MKFSDREVSDYYETCEVDYTLGWNLGRSVAMHYGYWDWSTRTHAQALERENAVLAELAAIGRNDRVLDAGCGMGGSAIYLADRFGCRVTGITLSERQAASATRGAKRCGVGHLTTFQQMNYLRTAFADDAFDVVWALESVCHAHDKAAFANEMYRILRRGGRLIVADGFAARETYDGAEKALMDGWLRGWCVEPLVTVQHFLECLRAAGFCRLSAVNATQNVIRSSKRLHALGRSMMWFAAPARLMGRKMRTRALNYAAARDQYLALTQGLWAYGIVSARKE